MAVISFYKRNPVPLELHKVKIVQQLSLLPIEERVKKSYEAGFNTFQLHNKDIYMDMLTDSGVNAMSDRMQAAMLTADDAYAGSETFYRMQRKINELFGPGYVLPAHQGRACEHILAERFARDPATVIPMNYHFTTAKALITRNGARVEELVKKEGLAMTSTLPFKGDTDIEALEKLIAEVGVEHIPYFRLEAGTNLIGGQPVSFQNMKAVSDTCRKHGIIPLMDASLLQDNLYFIKTRDPEFKYVSVRELTRMIADLFDIIYFSARKFGFARGGAIWVRDEKMFHSMEDYVPMFEGFLTYGGMSVKEMEAITVGLEETMDMDVISQGPLFTEYTVNEMVKEGIPMVTPAGGLGAHMNATEFLDHIPPQEYPAGALAIAMYIAGSVRGMERGTLSEERNPDGSERFASMELLRLALPRRVFTLSQVEYVIDRAKWLYDNRKLVGGLRFVHEPKTLRFFTGLLEPTSDWPEKLARKFRDDFGDSI